MEQDLSLLESLVASALNELHRLKSENQKQLKRESGIPQHVKDVLERRRRNKFKKPIKK